MRAQKIEIISWTPGQVLTDMSWPRAKESVEAVEPSFLWMFAQPPMALIGLVLRKNDFGKTWDGGGGGGGGGGTLFVIPVKNENPG